MKSAPHTRIAPSRVPGKLNSIPSHPDPSFPLRNILARLDAPLLPTLSARDRHSYWFPRMRLLLSLLRQVIRDAP